MKILVLGGDGMLGHQLFRFLKERHNIKATLRNPISTYERLGLFHDDNAFGPIDVRIIDNLVKVLIEFRPEAVINAVGIVKQRPAAKETLPSLEINALFPHRLSLLCKAMGIRMLHMSTDCVFSGRRGNYKETDLSDAEDLYGRTKYIGEVSGQHCLTIRTSFIGRELSRKQGLFEWFLSQRGQVQGFKNAIFSGFTTLEFSKIIEKILVNYPQKEGIYHISSEPISKYELLALIKRKMDFDIEINPIEDPRCDRSLNSEKFRDEFGYAPPPWEKMIDDLCRES
jgi:dTDP-4-dehydrorhamnose reductase